MPGNSAVATRNSGLEKQSPELLKPETSSNLPLSVSTQLFTLMTSVTKDNVNPDTVGAACKCAEGIYKMLLLNEKIKGRK
jgi:hypothetical protein